jgi:D-alanyl-D-alanine carboxypeptidase
MNRLTRWVIALAIFGGAQQQASAQESLAPALRAAIDSSIRDIITRTGTPSASIAIVQNGVIAYANAYGDAHIDPRAPASPSMRYSIGSVSKQFTATLILRLVEQGKLSLDDRIVKWFPGVTRAKDITVRQLLSMTSGISDYWAQDYVMSPMLKPISAQQIVDQFARAPLDFPPGTKYQYSNTNYVMLGMIIEKVTGNRFLDVLRSDILTPLKLTSAYIVDEGALPASDPERYTRYALGPNRVGPKEGKGWLYAAGELAMTASDLARWDIGVINMALMTPASYKRQQTATILDDGRPSNYALGVQVGSYDDHRLVAHSGGVSGFTTQNVIFPDDRAAIVVLTNTDATPAAGQIQAVLIKHLFAAAIDAPTEQAAAQMKTILAGLQRGAIERSLFTQNANDYFSASTLVDFKSSLGGLGTCSSISQANSGLRGGMTHRVFSVTCGTTNIVAATFTMANGQLEQLLVTPP